MAGLPEANRAYYCGFIPFYRVPGYRRPLTRTCNTDKVFFVAQHEHEQAPPHADAHWAAPWYTLCCNRAQSVNRNFAIDQLQTFTGLVVKYEKLMGYQQYVESRTDSNGVMTDHIYTFFFGRLESDATSSLLKPFTWQAIVHREPHPDRKVLFARVIMDVFPMTIHESLSQGFIQSGVDLYGTIPLAVRPRIERTRSMNDAKMLFTRQMSRDIYGREVTEWGFSEGPFDHTRDASTYATAIRRLQEDTGLSSSGCSSGAL